MAAPTYTPGQVLGAADCNVWFTPLVAYRTTTQTVTSSTTLVNDNTLFVPVTASSFWWVQCVLHYQGGVQGSSDLKWQWTVPAGGSFRYAASYLGSAGTQQIGAENTDGSTNVAGSNGAGNTRAVWMAGHMTIGVTAGNLQLQWAQNTSSGTGTVMAAMSAMILWRMG